MTALRWKKSTFSGNNGDCVELAVVTGWIVARDSKKPGPVLTIPAESFRSFIRGL